MPTLKGQGYHYEKIGMDPEFELIDSQGRIISGENIHGGEADWGEIGYDGCGGASCEFRPKANSLPTNTVNNLHHLFREFETRNPNRRLGVKGDRYPLGAHIQFGFREGRTVVHSDYVTNFIKLLDYFLGKPFLDLSGKARGAYKSLSNMREKAWGFEYRSLPSAVFATKDIALAVFTACHRIAGLYWGDSGIDMTVAQLRGMAYRDEYREVLGLNSTQTNTLFEFPREYFKMNHLGNILGSIYWPHLAATVAAPPPTTMPRVRQETPGDTRRLGEPFGPVVIPPGPATVTQADTQAFTDLGNGVRVRFRDEWAGDQTSSIIARLRRSRVGREHPLFLTFYGLRDGNSVVADETGTVRNWGFSFYSNGRNYTPRSRAQQYGTEPYEHLYLVRHQYTIPMDPREIAIGCPAAFRGLTCWSLEERIGSMNSILRIISLVNWMIRQNAGG